MDLPIVAKKMTENIWEEIHKVNICNNNFHSKSKMPCEEWLLILLI